MPRAPRRRQVRAKAPASSHPSGRKRYGKRVGRKTRPGKARWAKRQHVADTGIATLDLLALAHAVSRHSQWTSAKAAGTESVASWIRIYEMHQDVDAYKAFQRVHPGFGLSEDDEKVARDIVAWAIERAAMGNAGNDSDASHYYGYLANALASEEVSGRNFSLVCSAAAAYRAEYDRHVSVAHVGTIGARSVFNLTLNGVAPVPNRFGTMYRLAFHDRDLNAVVWFSSRSPGSLGLDFQRSYAVKATVKRHDDFRGSKQTVVTRGRLLGSPTTADIASRLPVRA